jgi:Inner membrane protein YgaP-like, transmembrane domain
LAAGLVLIITALVRWCPAYGILGVKTYPMENHR